jgi:ABC-type glycerol-3-phosphate transport system substrate-binding protein
MRKTFAVLTVVVMMISLFTACGGGGSQPTDSAAAPAENTNAAETGGATEPVKITFMVWGSTEYAARYVDAVYSAYPDLKDKYIVEPQVGGKGDGDVAQKIRLQLAAKGEMPDIVQFNRTQLSEFAEAGVLEDLAPVYEPVSDDLLEGAKQLVTYNGNYVAFPYEMKAKLWFYRQDLFDQAGIDPANIKTLEDFIEAGKVLHEKIPNTYITNLGSEIPGYWLGMLLSGNGARITDENGNFVVANDPGIRKAFEATKTLRDSGVTANISDWTPDWEKGFADGTIASSLIGSWFKMFLPQYAADQAGKWAVAQFPVIADAEGGSEAGGSVYVIPKDAPHKKEAIDFLSKAVLTKEGNLALHKELTLTPVLKSAISDPVVQQPDSFFGESLPQAESEALANLKVFPFDPSSDLEFKILNQYLTKHVQDGEDLEKALQNAQADMESQIGNPYQK